MNKLKFKFRKFNTEKYHTTYKKIKNENKQLARFILKNILICVIVSFIEIIGLIAMFQWIVDTWLAIALAISTSMIIEYFNVNSFYVTYNLLFRNFPELLNIYENRNEKQPTTKELQSS